MTRKIEPGCQGNDGESFRFQHVCHSLGTVMRLKGGEMEVPGKVLVG